MRFINGDSTGKEINLYSYCGNNPIRNKDTDGCRFQRIKAIGSKIWNSIKKPLKKIGTVIKSAITRKRHFETRIAKNGIHPSYKEVTSPGATWRKVPEWQTRYHDNGDEYHEEKNTWKQINMGIIQGEKPYLMEELNYL